MIEEMRFCNALLVASLLLASPLFAPPIRAAAAPADTTPSARASLHLRSRLAAFHSGHSTRAAQPRSGLDGTVSDTLGNFLEDVQVGLVGTPNYTVTDARGAFHLPQVKPGSYTLSMRRLGYDPFTMTFVILDGTPMSVDFELTAQAVRVAPLNIKAERISPKLRAVGFESRLKSSGAPPSHFITRAEIEKQHIQSITNIIDKMGGRARSCNDPAVFMDGLPYQTFADFGATTIGRSTGAVGATSTPARSPVPTSTKNNPLDQILIHNIEGLEIYTNSSETPPQFKEGLGSQQNNKCVVVVWTRQR